VDVVVLAKYVPNPAGSPPEIGPDFRLRREEADGGLDPSDEPGVEAAVRLAAAHGG
jgi:electron transfer flavoprotein alpha/beta subunit